VTRIGKNCKRDASAEFVCFLLQGIFISKISENGPAGQDGILKTGDKIMKVNFLLIARLRSKLFSAVRTKCFFPHSDRAKIEARTKNIDLSPLS